MRIYLARDGEKDGEYLGEIYLFTEKPPDNDFYFWRTKGGFNSIPLHFADMPELKNGECREAKIVLESGAAEGDDGN